MKLHRKLLMSITILALLMIASMSPRLLPSASVQASARSDQRTMSITLTVDESTATAGLQAIWSLLPLPDWLSFLSPQVNFKPDHLACVNLMANVPIFGQIAVAHACLKAQVIDGQLSITVDSVGGGASVMVNGKQVEIKNIDKAARKVKKAFKRYVKQIVKQAASEQGLLGLTISDIYTDETTLNIVISSES